MRRYIELGYRPTAVGTSTSDHREYHYMCCPCGLQLRKQLYSDLNNHVDRYSTSKSHRD